MPIHVLTHVTASGNVTSSYTSTGSFGRVYTSGTVSASEFIGDGSKLTNIAISGVDGLSGTNTGDVTLGGSGGYITTVSYTHLTLPTIYSV